MTHCFPHGKLRLLLLPLKLTVILSILTTFNAFAQRTVTGTVADKDQLPVAGANVVVKGTQVGAITDGLGKYSIAVPSGGNTLIISFIGYTSQEVPIGASSVINVTLQSESTSLGEVVVVGYGTQRRAVVTGAISSVSSEKLTAVPSGQS